MAGLTRHHLYQRRRAPTNLDSGLRSLRIPADIRTGSSASSLYTWPSRDKARSQYTRRYLSISGDVHQHESESLHSDQRSSIFWPSDFSVDDGSIFFSNSTYAQVACFAPCLCYLAIPRRRMTLRLCSARFRIKLNPLRGEE